MIPFSEPIWMLSDIESRSISPENLAGERGGGGRAETGTAQKAAAELGRGWKMNPFVVIEPGQSFEMARIRGPGRIDHLWLTPTGKWRDSVLRLYWEGSEFPSVECPVGDFFACGLQEYWQVSSLAVCVNPGSAFNSYWPMPFRSECRMTMTNEGRDPMRLYYQVDYSLLPLPEGIAYFHAQFRRVNPLPYKGVYTILDGVRGRGHYAGTYLAWGTNNSGWWGEGEVKFYIDGDGEFPTICGTGTEDYFCGSYDFEVEKSYRPFSSPYSGFQVSRPDGLYRSQTRFGMYRWHLADPVRFSERLRVTIQALGWRPDGRYLPLQDDIASVAFWYQSQPSTAFPPLPDRDYRELL